MDEMVDVTFADLQSTFLILPKGTGFIEYVEFQEAYEVLKRETNGFKNFTEKNIWEALKDDSLTLVVVRTIFGVSPPEWAELARSEENSDVSQNAARGLDTKVREDRAYFANLLSSGRSKVTLNRTKAMVKVAVTYISRGAPSGAEDTVHRLAKVDTAEGLTSLQHAADFHVPYAVVLYERYLGRPFASHRDAISELVGDVMESAVESRLAHSRITFRKTKRAERVPGFEQAPDFFVPTETAPSVIIEAKITSDDGTARDKVSRIIRLAEMRNTRLREGRASFEVVACIDGRGFGVRRNDMRDMLKATEGKVFTLATLDKLVPNTGLRDFVPRAGR